MILKYVLYFQLNLCNTLTTDFKIFEKFVNIINLIKTFNFTIELY